MSKVEKYEKGGNCYRESVVAREGEIEGGGGGGYKKRAGWKGAGRGDRQQDNGEKCVLMRVAS